MSDRTPPPDHPGRFVDEQMRARGLTNLELARALGVSPQFASDLRHGRRGISANLAIRLSQWTGSTALYWLHVQAYYDLWQTETRDGRRIRAEVTPGDWPPAWIGPQGKLPRSPWMAPECEAKR